MLKEGTERMNVRYVRGSSQTNELIVHVVVRAVYTAGNSIHYNFVTIFHGGNNCKVLLPMPHLNCTQPRLAHCKPCPLFRPFRVLPILHLRRAKPLQVPLLQRRTEVWSTCILHAVLVHLQVHHPIWNADVPFVGPTSIETKIVLKSTHAKFVNQPRTSHVIVHNGVPPSLNPVQH